MSDDDPYKEDRTLYPHQLFALLFMMLLVLTGCAVGAAIWYVLV